MGQCSGPLVAVVEIWLEYLISNFIKGQLAAQCNEAQNLSILEPFFAKSSPLMHWFSCIQDWDQVEMEINSADTAIQEMSSEFLYKLYLNIIIICCHFYICKRCLSLSDSKGLVEQMGPICQLSI